MLRPQFIQAPSRRGETSEVCRVAPLACPPVLSDRTNRSNVSRASARRGFTLVEILVATVLTLVLMGMVVTVFGTVTEEISNSRATIETADRLRSTQLLLQRDLAGATARMVPPLRPEENLGYFEYIEGPIGPVLPLRPVAGAGGYDIEGALDDIVNIQGTTLGDFDDVLMFTSRNLETPFRGIANGQSISSPVAEVIWFLRGTTLFRRTLLVAPAVQSAIPTADLTSAGFYGKYDLSARQVGGTNDINAATSGGPARLVLNTLGDLTKRENRYGHQPWVFPHDARFWGLLGMPTLQECSFYEDLTDVNLRNGLWPFPLQAGTATFTTTNVLVGGVNFQLIQPVQAYDTATAEYMDAPATASGVTSIVPGYANNYFVTEFRHEETLDDLFEPWFNPIPWHDVDSQTATLIGYDLGDNADGYYPNSTGDAGSTRVAEDVILTNVLSFDVKVWDPGAPILQFTPASGSAVAVLPSDAGYVDLLTKALNDLANDTVSDTEIVSFGAYVDLNYMCRRGGTLLAPDYNLALQNTGGEYVLQNKGATQPWFHGPGDPRSHLMGSLPNTPPTIANARAAVYDTWSSHYEYDGLDQDYDTFVDEGTDGFDNLVASASPYTNTSDAMTGTRYYGVDDYNEQEAVPPYPSPLKGVQITIRVFEPDSRSIREVTIVQDFQAAASGTNYE